jgi:uncharacterized damage-inducible protein DinB
VFIKRLYLFQVLNELFFGSSLFYKNMLGKAYVEHASVAVAHFFNHQTDHRGRVHAMSSQTKVAPPSFDLRRMIYL